MTGCLARGDDHDTASECRIGEFAPTLPKRFCDITLVRKIGPGSRGIVYEARRKGRRVAVRILPIDVADHGRIERFQREAASAAMLCHPNIVPLFQFGRFEGIHYYVMPYVKGRTLSDHFRAGPLSPRIAARLALQAARALDHAHSAGIVHRDIKPQNLMIADRLLVADFGLAPPAEEIRRRTFEDLEPADLVDFRNFASRVDHRDAFSADTVADAELVLGVRGLAGRTNASAGCVVGPTRGRRSTESWPRSYAVR